MFCSACSALQVLDIEESIWSPRLGIKGMVDVSVRANLAARTAPGSHQAAKPKPGTWQHALKPCGQGKASKGPGAAAPARGSLAREGATDMGNSNAAEMQDMIMALELKTGKATQGQVSCVFTAHSKCSSGCLVSLARLCDLRLWLASTLATGHSRSNPSSRSPEKLPCDISLSCAPPKVLRYLLFERRRWWTTGPSSCSTPFLCPNATSSPSAQGSSCTSTRARHW